ncbi:hypothetical protein BDZ88DRAFT_422703 [Geranomyces variabilis]|nr:hypothetical protein BDZ88DRAFT_422703 [Geranomyces variabilis]KAJ3134453.1 hypothetical protein HDU90_005067 [Geranomyces variabilis]
MAAETYAKFLKQLAHVTALAPKGKVPKQYNFDKFVPTPFHNNNNPSSSPSTSASSSASASASASTLHNIPLRQRSELYAKSGLATQSALDSLSAPPSSPSPQQQQQQQYLRDIPLPTVLTRHIHLPSPALSKQTQLGKITGFRIEVTGRRGTRSSTQRFAYGRLGTGNVGGAYVDFAKSVWVNKKGATGVKVYIGYGR